MWESLASNLPHLTAALNLIAIVLLVLGFINIRRGLVRRHKTMMLSALGVSAVFLLVYLLHKLSLYMATGEWNNKFPTDPEVASTAARYTYYGILITHLMLAIIVPVLAVRAVFLAMKGRIAEHKRLVRFAYPAWIYVSVTGVLVYLMLYQIYG
jgi:protein SCO1/2/putative membrane protein